LERQKKIAGVLSKEKLFNKDQQIQADLIAADLRAKKAIQSIVSREGRDHEDVPRRRDEPLLTAHDQVW
jgi:hypothetical protein